jgi:rhodanese-related sulfurtransferase
MSCQEENDVKESSGRFSIIASMKRRWLVIVLALLLCSLAGGYGVVQCMPTWTQINLWLDWRFSDVSSISTEQLDTLLTQARSQGGPAPLLIDVRTAQEYAVSHLPGARHVAVDQVLDVAERELAQIDRSQPIVVYCSVGVRSAAAARDLQLAGFTQVKNLRGSLFQWANEGRELQGGQRVHPFDVRWGRLLREDLRAPLESSLP